MSPAGYCAVQSTHFWDTFRGRKTGYSQHENNPTVSLSSDWPQLPATFMRSISTEPTVLAPRV
jgi:hypothetical protein